MHGPAETAFYIISCVTKSIGCPNNSVSMTAIKNFKTYACVTLIIGSVRKKLTGQTTRPELSFLANDVAAQKKLICKKVYRVRSVNLIFTE
jgi:hypothetical protein